MTEISKSIALIDSVVAHYYGAGVEDIRLNSQDIFVVKLRDTCMFLCAEQGYSDPIIAKEYSMSRISVYNAITRTGAKLRKSTKYASEIKAIKTHLAKAKTLYSILEDWFEKRHDIKSKVDYQRTEHTTLGDVFEEIHDFLKHIGLITK